MFAGNVDRNDEGKFYEDQLSRQAHSCLFVDATSISDGTCLTIRREAEKSLS